MTEKNPDNTPQRMRRPRLRLPFDNRRPDIGTWAYDHRAGLCVTLIAYLVLMIGFVAGKIVVGRRASTQGIYIDLQTLAQLEQERDRLEQEVRRRQEEDPLDWRSIRNRASNENALDEELRDDRGSNAAAINDAATEAQERMRANREAYEAGLAEERAISERRGREDGSERQDSKAKGRVTVSYSFVDPVRTSRRLEVPAYLCEGGGDVEVSVTLDRTGKVTGARVVSGGDDCMREAALRAARASRFNIDEAAPARQTGTITYIFIPQ
ncbi:TonB family protein [Alistipes sp.]|uniref:TonB family protein n=1 Tax=Alistipes sp. TaxID=1872444 RepID=UPI003AEF66C0